MDVLRENIGLLLLEGADHSKWLRKIAKARGISIVDNDEGGEQPTFGRASGQEYDRDRDTTIRRLNALSKKNSSGYFNPGWYSGHDKMKAKHNQTLSDLRIERFWDKGKVKLKDPSFDVRDRNNSVRNFNLARAQQLARSVGQEVKKIDGGKRITTTTYDPIHHKQRIETKDVMDPPKSNPIDKTQHFKRPGNLATLGLIGAGVGIGGGLYALRKRLKNKNKPFFRRLFNR